MTVEYPIVENFIKGKTSLPVYSDSCHSCKNLHSCPVYTSGDIIEQADHVRAYCRGLRQGNGQTVLLCGAFEYNEELAPNLKTLREKVIKSKNFRYAFEETKRDPEENKFLSLESSKL